MKRFLVITLLLLLTILLFVSSVASKRGSIAAFADLSLTKVDTPDPVNAGSQLTYTITVTNNGPDPAADATWSDTLPTGVFFKTLSSESGWSCTTPAAGDVGTISCSNPSFSVGSSVFTLTVTASSNSTPGSTIENTATVASSTTDNNPGNESGTATTTVLSPSNIHGNKSVSGEVSPGSAVTYNISLSNLSSSAQADNPGAEFTDVLPSDLTLVSADASSGTATADVGTNTVTWNGRIEGLDSVTISITAIINSGTEGHTVANQGSISYDADGNGTNESTAQTNQVAFDVEAAPISYDLSITKTGPSQVHADSNVTYTITVTNFGPSAAADARFKDTLPNSVSAGFPMTFVSFTQTSGTTTWDDCNVTSSPIVCRTSSLPAGTTSTFTLVGHVPGGSEGKQYTNQVRLIDPSDTDISDTSDVELLDNNNENNSGSAVTTVASCFNDQVVTTSADSGPGSLRQAILDACDGSTISFDMTQVVSPINLASVLSINKSLIFQGPGATQLTISGNNTTRIFEIALPSPSSVNVTIADLQLANSPDSAIYDNSTGTLNITNAIIANNSTVGGGGGINNNGGGAINVRNSTFDHNSAQSGGGIDNQSGGAIAISDSTFSFNSISNSGAGGGIFNNNGPLTITNSTFSNNSTNPGTGAAIFTDTASSVVAIVNSTISNNQANGNGGGIQTGATAVRLQNTIVAGNTATANGQDVIGTFTSNGHNLIGQDDPVVASGFTNGMNGDIVGTTAQPVDARLGPLANNGGATQTLALLPGSPALDAASDVTSLNGGIDDSTTTINVVDAAAFPATSSFVIQVDSEQMIITGKAGNVLTVTRGANGSPAAHADGAMVNPAFDQRGANFTRIIDGPDADSTATADIGAFEAQVSVEDIPDKTTNEDTQLQFDFTVGGNVLTVTATSSNTAVAPDPSLSGSGSTRTMTINPVANQFGTPTITVTVSDNNGQSMTDTFTLTVNSVNDVPSFTKGADQTVAEDAGPQSISSWATNISAGPANEGGQTLAFNVTGNTNASLFSAGPAIDPLTGTLSYTPAANANGTATITIVLMDNGGTANGGQDTSAPQTFSITVNPVNDRPSFTKGSDQTVNEDAGPQTVANWATAISPGPPDESGQTVAFQITNNTNAALFSAGPAINPTGTLSYTPAANAHGTATITAVLTDNGGTANGGQDTSAPQNFAITINPVADTPSVTNASTTVNTQTTSGLVISRNPADGAEVTHFKITNITGGTLFKNDGTTQINNGNFITFAEGNAGLKFTPALNSNANGSFDVQGATSNSDTGLSGTATATITVNCGSTVVSNISDSGAGSLRTTILQACDGATITFQAGLSNVTLTSAQLLIDKNLTITGPGANLLSVMRSSAGGTPNFRIFNIQSGKTVNISDLTIANGKLNGTLNLGGGISNSGTLTLTNITLSGNSVSGGNSSAGGGIYNDHGTLNLTNSTLSGNSATLGSASNLGGGIYNDHGALNLTNSTLSGNSAGGGAGIFNDTGTLTITNSTLSGNSASAAGGGISNNFGGTLTLTNSTFSNNSATNLGGGIFNLGTAQLRNSIIALNTSNSSPDLNGSVTSNGHNLIGNNSGATITPAPGASGDLIGTNAAPINPQLGSLANYGGPTQTMALLAGSPALDAGDNCVTDAAHCGDSNIPQLTTDQRGGVFSRVVDGPDADTTATVDIGAFEAQVSVEDIPDKTTNEDTQLQFTFNLGGGANITSVTATSSNTTLVPNNPANIALSGSGSTRTLTINPVANLFGTSTITVTVNGNNSQIMTDTFVLTVSPVADTPSVTNASTTVNTQTTSGLVINRSPADGAEVTNFKITNITGGTLFKNNGTTQINNGTFITVAEGNAGLKFTPALDSNANGSFQVQASISSSDAGLGGGLATAAIAVNCGATVVINSNDSGAGSLRDTILHACVGATITFDLTPGKVANPITLTSSELLINKNLIVQGPNANVLTLQRSAAGGTPLFSIFNIPSGVTLGLSGLTLSNADTANNGGAIKNGGVLNLDSMALSNNHTAAGGSALFNGATGTVTITNSTFSNNRADVWAAIYNQGGALSLTNSTLTANANQGTNPGAAIFSESLSGVTNITNCTISQNTGQAEVVFRNPGGASPITLKNTIVSGNTGGNVSGTTDNGNNLIGGNALLAALGNYGGPTQTMALLPGSPAINAGTATGAPATDQRGISRVGAVDIGAFESRGFNISAASGTPQSATILSAFGAPLIASVTGVGGEPVNGGSVTFTAPASGASAVLTGGGSNANVTIAGGQASINATANAVGGSYNVSAGANGATSASFSLTNTKAATSTAITSSLNPSDFNQSVTFTATVSGAVPSTGTVQFKDNGSNLGSPVALNGSGVAQLTTSTLAAGNHTITADYSGDGNLLPSTGTLAGGQTVRFRPLIKFSQSTYSVNENGNAIAITVVRSGDTSLPVTVDYATPDDSAAMTVLPCSNANGVASPRCDFTTTIGTLRFAAGETSKSFNVLISQDLWLEGNETVQLTLSNPTGGAAFQQPSDASAVLTIVDDDTSSPSTNAIDNSNTFVRQHYHDFLNREPDQAGFNFWVNQIESCGADTQCRAVKRINVSAAFFLSIEFQNTGYFVERMYKAGYGDIAPPTVPVPIRFTEFVRDTQQIRGDVIVGVGDWQTQLDNNKKSFALDFVQRTAFINRYPAITNETAFVDALNANAGMVLSDAERSALIAELAPNPSSPALRADVLMKVADNAVLQQREFNRAFVLMQYFGYLRRNPDAAPEASLNFNGYNFWLGKLNQFNGDYVGAELIKAFITSSEYRGRFGP